MNERLRGCEAFQQKATGPYDVVFDGEIFLRSKLTIESTYCKTALVDIYEI